MNNIISHPKKNNGKRKIDGPIKFNMLAFNWSSVYPWKNDIVSPSFITYKKKVPPRVYMKRYPVTLVMVLYSAVSLFYIFYYYDGCRPVAIVTQWATFPAGRLGRLPQMAGSPSFLSFFFFRKILFRCIRIRSSCPLFSYMHTKFFFSS